ncbi:unnamed protein product, partial [Ectocarpus fasciculatus]
PPYFSEQNRCRCRRDARETPTHWTAVSSANQNSYIVSHTFLTQLIAHHVSYTYSIVQSRHIVFLSVSARFSLIERVQVTVSPAYTVGKKKGWSCYCLRSQGT